MLLHKLKGCSDMKDIKVLACSEDCPKRYFADWHAKFVKLPTESDVGVDDPVADSFQVYGNLMDIGVRLHEKDISTADLEAALGSLAKYYGDLLPSNERLVAFTASDAVTSLDDFMEIFDDPVKVDLESDLVWPLQQIVDSSYYV
jgi:hypothetical protein